MKVICISGVALVFLLQLQEVRGGGAASACDREEEAPLGACLDADENLSDNDRTACYSCVRNATENTVDKTIECDDIRSNVNELCNDIKECSCPSACTEIITDFALCSVNFIKDLNCEVFSCDYEGTPPSEEPCDDALERCLDGNACQDCVERVTQDAVDSKIECGTLANDNNALCTDLGEQCNTCTQECVDDIVNYGRCEISAQLGCPDSGDLNCNGLTFQQPDTPPPTNAPTPLPATDPPTQSPTDVPPPPPPPTDSPTPAPTSAEVVDTPPPSNAPTPPPTGSVVPPPTDSPTPAPTSAEVVNTPPPTTALPPPQTPIPTIGAPPPSIGTEDSPIAAPANATPPPSETAAANEPPTTNSAPTTSPSATTLIAEDTTSSAAIARSMIAGILLSVATFGFETVLMRYIL